MLWFFLVNCYICQSTNQTQSEKYNKHIFNHLDSYNKNIIASETANQHWQDIQIMERQLGFEIQNQPERFIYQLDGNQ